MSAPSGLGVWIAYRPQNAVDVLRRVGASWVAPRAGLNGWNDPGLTVGRLQEYKDAGLYTAPWIYPTMTAWHGAVGGFKRLHQTGLCDGLIVDAEAEWCGPDATRNAIEALAFVAELRRECPGAWIAHAPMDYVGNHPTFPWVEFGRLDAVMPQCYAWEHDDRGHAHHMEAVERQWAAFEAAHPGQPPRWPIGCTYRPRARMGRVLTPLPPGTIVRDVAAFLDHPLTMAAAAPSLYSLEAAPPDVIEMLAARVPGPPQPGPTHPETPASLLAAELDDPDPHREDT